MALRKTSAQRPEWIVDEENNFYGISMGADFTSEHEWGIDGIEDAFGIIGEKRGKKNNVYGLKRYLAKDINEEEVYVREEEDSLVLIVDERGFSNIGQTTTKYRDELSFNDLLKYNELTIYDFKDGEKETLATSWYANGFAIHARGEESKGMLQTLIKAILNNDVAIYLGAPPLPAFSNSSLMIMIASTIPEEGKQQMLDVHKKHAKLLKDAKKTKIEDTLREAGKQWFALSPTRIDKEEQAKLNTAYTVKFWLNPMEQKKNNSGYYTVEELELWAKDEGPIPFKNAVKT